MSRSGCEAPTTQRLRCIGQGLVPENKDHPATHLAAMLENAVGDDPHGLTDCESVENCGFIAVLGSPMRQLCARFQVCARPSRSTNFGRFPATNNLNCHRVDNS